MNLPNLNLSADTQIPLNQALTWLHSVNPNYDFVEALVRTLYEVGPSQWEAPDWLLAQTCLETGNGLSELALKYKNFGGIGVNGQTFDNPQSLKPASPSDGSNDWLWVLYKGKTQWTAGLSRPNVVEGALMMIAHRKAFTDPNYNVWANSHDPRYKLARENRLGHNWPLATTIDYFGNGKWAADDTGYGQKCIDKFTLIRDWRKI